MATYDRRLINEFADRLYSRAGSVIFTYTFIGILTGGAFYPFSRTTAIILAVIFGFIGFLIGNEKAFWYKFQAQVTLCQAKIEENTSTVNLKEKVIDKTIYEPTKTYNLVFDDRDCVSCPICSAKFKLDSKELHTKQFECTDCNSEIHFERV